MGRAEHERIATGHEGLPSHTEEDRSHTLRETCVSTDERTKRVSSDVVPADQG